MHDLDNFLETAWTEQKVRQAKKGKPVDLDRRAFLTKAKEKAGDIAWLTVGVTAAGGLAKVAWDYIMPQDARAEGCRTTIPVNEAYAIATPYRGNNLLDGLRRSPKYDLNRGICGSRTKITPMVDGRKIFGWSQSGQFTRDYNGRYGEVIKRVLRNYGVDLARLESTINRIGGERGISFYDAGYGVITGQKHIYFFPCRKRIASAFFKASG